MVLAESKKNACHSVADSPDYVAHPANASPTPSRTVLTPWPTSLLMAPAKPRKLVPRVGILARLTASDGVDPTAESIGAAKYLEAGDIDEAILGLGVFLVQDRKPDRVLAGLEAGVRPIKGQIASRAELVHHVDRLVVDRHVGLAGIVVAVAEPANSGALEDAFDCRADDV